jgi:hypothetical protein
MSLRRLLPAAISLCAVASTARAADAPPSPERIAVAPDAWSLQTAVSKNPWVPWGVNYTPGWAGWAPDYFSDTRWDEARVAADFDTMRGLGVNCVKVVLGFERALPDPQPAGAAAPCEAALKRLDRMLVIAGERGIRILVTLHPDWYGGTRWYHGGGGMYGPGSHRILESFWSQVIPRYRGDGRILAWSFSVETHLAGWGAGAALEAWRTWAKEQYGTVEKANAAWKTSLASWDELKAPAGDGLNAADWRKQPEGTGANENRTDDPFYYDFLLFREFAAFRFMYLQSCAIKAADPVALTTMGFVQWNPILRTLWKPFHEGPVQGTEFSTREMAKAFDLLGIHFYPVYPGGDEEKQLRYLEAWARWAYAGKPVILEEFNQPPAARNIAWCPRVVERSKGLVCGWLVWTFRDTVPSDHVTEVCGLLDREGKPTPWAERFRELGRAVAAEKPVHRAPTRAVKVDKRRLYTSGAYRELLDGLLAAPDRDVQFELESNASIDRLVSDGTGAAVERR